MSTPIYAMTSREFEAKIRTGMTVGDFCAEYGCSDEEFDARIRVIYTQERKRKEISRKLKSNEKLKSRNGQSKKSTSPTPQAKRIAKPAPQAAADDEPKGIETSAERTEPEASKPAEPETIKPAEPETTQPTELEVLMAKEEALSEEICQLEVDHKEAWNEHRKVADSIRSIFEHVEKLKAELKACVDDYQVKLGEARKYETEMTQKSADWRVKRAELDEVRARIAKLTAVSVFVYEDGNIEAEDCKLNFDGWETRYSELLESDNEALENLRKKDIRALAKIMSLADEERTFEFIFDNPTLEEVYRTMK